MPIHIIPVHRFGWRLTLALFFYLSALTGLLMGVSLTERPDIVSSDFITKAYYSLGLFVLGGMDIGLPTGGPALGRLLLWTGYFGAPILAASTLIEALLKSLNTQQWQMRNLNNHIIVVGSDALTVSYLNVLRKHAPLKQVLVVNQDMDPITEKQFMIQFNAKILTGDYTNKFFMKHMHLDKAYKILFLSRNNFLNYEAANRMLKFYPELENKIIIQDDSIRFMRSVANTNVALKTAGFNSFQLAAAGLVQEHLIWHFLKTTPKDVVVIAGFGIFGQLLLEELQKYAKNELDTVAIVDLKAKRRVMIADEQQQQKLACNREVYQGDISNPKLWKKLLKSIDLENLQPVILLVTGSTEENLRNALWLRTKFPKAMIIARSNKKSSFARDIGKEHNIITISISQLVEDNIPRDWVVRE